jgi:hypothetical protein
MDFEADVQRVYEAVLRPGMGAVDVGAHVGRHGMGWSSQQRLECNPRFATVV